MKRHSVLSVLFVTAVVAGLSFVWHVSAQKRTPKAQATKNVNQPAALPTQALLVDDFTAAPGTLLSTTGWSAHSGIGTNSIATVSGGLSYTGYPSSGIGNAATMTTSGEDVNKQFPIQTSGSIYAAAMVNVSAAQATGDYFLHFVDGPITGNLFKARLFVKKDPATANFAFGIQKSSTLNTTYTGFIYSPGTTYLVVIKYTIVAGTVNDTVDLIVNPTLGGAEPVPTVSAVLGADADAIDIRGVALRQGSASNSATLQVDGIRVATSWNSLLAPAPNRAGDFDGDGRTDWTITRANGGLKEWWIQFNGYSGSAAGQFGLATDRAIPADFDGDGKTDIAVWREAPSDVAAFYILQSSTATVRTELFGQTGDSPKTVADYDGDGKADVSVYRQGAAPGDQSYFYYRGSQNNPTGIITYVPWGTNGDIQTVGDFDGDGKADFCIRRDIGGQGTFILLRSSDSGVEFIPWGLPTDTIVPGDYDGDGKSDFCLARIVGGAGYFYILQRNGGGTGAAPIVFGNAALDLLAPGDYDGDGKTDIAVWRANADPSNNYFWVRLSSNGNVFNNEWGQNGDETPTEWNVSGGN